MKPRLQSQEEEEAAGWIRGRIWCVRVEKTCLRAEKRFSLLRWSFMPETDEDAVFFLRTFVFFDEIFVAEENLLTSLHL